MTAALLVFALSGCSVLFGSPASDLSDARRKWSRQKLESYEYVIAMPYPARVIVCADTVTEVTSVNDHSVSYSRGPVLYSTVNELLDGIAHALQRRAYKLKVKYDDRRGFPTRIDIDYRHAVFDDEVNLTIVSLRPHSC